MSIKVQPNGNGTFDVIAICGGGCNRRVEQSNITALNSTAAAIIADERLSPEGWEGGTCRACLLHTAGWQSDPLNYRQTGGRR
jgi:hypothetical protein